MNRKTISFAVLAIFAVAGMFYMFGYNAQPKAAPVAAPAPAPSPSTVTVTAEPVVNEVVVNEIPAVCFDALDRADEAFAYTGEVFGVVSEVLNAMGDLDLAAMEKSVDKLGEMREELTGKLEIYKTARDACRVNAKR